MRVMQFASAETAGGLLRHVEILAGGLARAGHQVRAVLSPAPGADEAAAACAAAGAAVTRLAVRGKADPVGLSRFWKLVANEKPDILHAHLASPVEAMPALMAARLGGPRRIVTTEHAPTWSPLEKPYSRIAKKTTGRSIDAVIALSHSDAGFLQLTFGVPASRIAVIPNGVPMPAARPQREQARERLGLPATDGPVVGYAGSLETKKGVLDLLEAAALAVKRGLAGLAVALAGAGSLEADLRRKAASLPFPLVVCGRVREVDAFLAGLDLFALPSHQEAMPLALLEAMAAGLPIVASRVGGVPEAIEDGVTGLLVEPSHPGQIAEAIVRLWEDGDLRGRVAAGARRAARERFDAEIMLERVETLYRGLLAAAAPGRG